MGVKHRGEYLGVWMQSTKKKVFMSFEVRKSALSFPNEVLAVDSKDNFCLEKILLILQFCVSIETVLRR